MVVPMLLPPGVNTWHHSDQLISTNDYGGEEAALGGTPSEQVHASSDCMHAFFSYLTPKMASFILEFASVSLKTFYYLMHFRISCAAPILLRRGIKFLH
jgi:hypothetical protein